MRSQRTRITRLANDLIRLMLRLGGDVDIYALSIEGCMGGLYGFEVVEAAGSEAPGIGCDVGAPDRKIAAKILC